MAEADEAAPRERGWGRPLLALGALAFLPVLPWARIVMPIEQPLLLLFPAIAACALVAWKDAGRAWQAILWLAVTGWVVVGLLWGRGATSFDRVVVGWSLILAACFGLACLAMPAAAFISRAIVAVSVAVAIGLALSATGRSGAPEPFGLTLRAELSERTSTSVASLQLFIDSSAALRDLKEQSPELRRYPVILESSLHSLTDTVVMVYPALFALEGLAALALAWALFHRLSRTRIGAPLSRLRDFRFSDQLVWGLLLGAAIIAVPTLDEWRFPGWNLLLFFGGLYSLRGLAVVLWFLTPVSQILVMLLITVVLLAVPKFGVPLTFGVGLGDTWMNWRSRPKPVT